MLFILKNFNFTAQLVTAVRFLYLYKLRKFTFHCNAIMIHLISLNIFNFCHYRLMKITV